ncbi:MAG: glycosyltransferase family 9 protein [Chloroflexi bacterium]|nr:glycosyltransferase family 9 protein [Chloroflexota bacterium]
MRPVVPLPAKGRRRRKLKAILGRGVLAIAGGAARLSRLGRGPRPDVGGLWPFPEPPRSILLVRFDLIGDTVMSLALAADLKSIFSDSEITFLTTPGSARIAEICPYVDCSLAVDMPAVTHLQGALSRHTWTTSISAVREIRKSRFDLAISLYGPLAGCVTGLSGARWRVGYKSEAPAGCFDFALPGRRLPGTKHEVEWIRGLAGRDGGTPAVWDLAIPDDAGRRGAEMLPKGDEALIVIHTGARNGGAKIWPAERWKELAVLINEETGARLVTIGDEFERKTARSVIRSVPRTHDLTGKTSLAELAAVISRCDVLISGDSGPLHLATALGKRVVGLYGPTDPVLSGPFADDAIIVRTGIPCSPCYDLRAPADCPFGDTLCMEWITPRQVMEAALKQLERRRAG